MMQKLFNEKDIRLALCRYIKRSNWKRSDVLIPEYFVDNASRRADLIAANGHLAAYEIKSDFDHLRRLQGQIDVFTKVFEAVTVVCTERHFDSVLATLPETVGIIQLLNSGFQIEREATIVPINDMNMWLSHLPISAIRSMLLSRSIKSPKSNRDLVINIAKQHLSTEEVRNEVLRYLKSTKKQQRKDLQDEKKSSSKSDPLQEHKEMLHEYLKSRGIAV